MIVLVIKFTLFKKIMSPRDKLREVDFGRPRRYKCRSIISPFLKPTTEPKFIHFIYSLKDGEHWNMGMG